MIVSLEALGTNAYSCGFNKGRSSRFCEGSRVRQTPEEGRRTYRPKHCENNKDEDNSQKTLPNKNSICLTLIKKTESKNHLSASKYFVFLQF